MGRIDTSAWGEFSIDELFPRIVKPHVLHARQVMETEGGIPYIVRSKFNNGVKMRVEPVDGIEPSPAGVITWGAENATFFYQAEPFYSGRDIYYIDTTDIEPAACLFLSTCLQTVAKGYEYSFGLFPDQLRGERIKLPQTDDGRPDWDAMESCMADTMRHAETRTGSLELAHMGRTAVDTASWRPFRIGDLFDLVKGTRLTRADMLPGDTPFIGATLENNGVTAHVGNTGHLHPAGTMTVAYNGQKATGKAFWQPVEYWASDDVNVLYPKFDLTREVALFLQPIFWEVGRPYAFDDKWRLEVMADDSLMLPATDASEPDWNLMQVRMEETLAEASQRITALSALEEGVD